MRNFNMDAQSTIGFLVDQTAKIEAEVYDQPLADIRYPTLVPVDTTAGEWTKTVTFYSNESVGRAGWFNGRAQDVPNVELLRDRDETRIQMAAIGYEYAQDEIAYAMRMGMNLEGDKAAAARRAYEEFVDQIALFGDPTKRMEGLFNSSRLSVGQAAPVGTLNGQTASTRWADKTHVQIGFDLNGELKGQFNGTFGAEISDTVLLPYDVIQDLGTRTIGDNNQQTILAWLRENNIFTQETGRPLLFRGFFGLETAGVGGTSRMLVYRRDPLVLKLHIPMPLKWLPLWRKGPITYEVPAIFRLGGVNFKRPKAARYLDGI